MPTSTESGMLSPTYRHHVLTRSLLTGGIGSLTGRRIGGFHYEDGGKAGSQGAAAESKQGDDDKSDGDGDDADADAKTRDDSGLRSALQKEREARKTAEKSLKAVETRIAEIEGKDKSDVERLTGERDKLLKDLEARGAKLRTTLAEQAVRDAAESAGARNPRLIFRLVKDDLEIEDDGSVGNLDAAIKSAKKTAPELFGAANGRADGGQGSSDRTEPSSMNALLRQKAGYSR